MIRWMAFVSSLCVLLCVGFGTATAQEFLVRVEVDKDRPDQRLAHELVSSLSCIPGVALLEGIRVKEMEREYALSEAGLTENEVRDRRMTPHLRVIAGESQAGDGQAPRQSVTLVGPDGKRESVSLDAGDPSATSDPTLRLEPVLQGIARLSAGLPGSPWERSCLSEPPRVDLMEDGTCLKMISCQCGQGDLRAVFCVARAAHQLIRRASKMSGSELWYSEPTAAELALAQRVKDNDKTLAQDKAAMAVFEQMAIKSQAFQKRCDAARQTFRDACVERMTSWLSFPMPSPGFTRQEETGKKDFAVGHVMLTGLRWSPTDNGPVFQMSLNMEARTTIREMPIPGGGVRRIREILRSFAMKVYDGTGQELYHGRLLVDEGRSEGGTITTVLNADILSRTTTYWFGDVQRRDVVEQ